MSQRSTERTEVGTKVLGEFITDAYKLTLKAINNKLECRADITIFDIYDKDNSLTPTELISILGNYNIKESVDLEQVAIFCSEAAYGLSQENILLARGREPVHGQDGWFELHITTGKEPTQLSEDDSGRVDFKSIQTFTNVEPGQQVGTIYPPTPGEDGRDITGECIPPIPGKPSRIVVGSGAELSEDGGQITACRQGRAVFTNNVISIEEEFLVQGDVDFTIGHINFNGFVNITGDVLDDFNITATKGINVSGSIGASQINSDGPVTAGSVAGLNKGKIICKGSFAARYLNQARIECWGNIQIENEVRNSILKATGRIDVPKGLITGGEIVALEGIEAKNLGGRASGGTELTSGIYFPEADRVNFLRNQTKSISHQLYNIGSTLKRLVKTNQDNLSRALQEATALRREILTQREQKLEAERTELELELHRFTPKDHPTANPKVNILGSVKEKVFITLGETREEIPPDMNGPMSIVKSKGEDRLQYQVYSPLRAGGEEKDEE